MKVKTTFWHKCLIALGLLALGTATVFLILSWDSLPEKVPMHYNAAGEIDNYGDRSALFVPLAIGWALYGLLSLVSFLPAVWNSPGNSSRSLQATKDMLEVLKLLLALDFSWLLVCGVLGQEVGSWFLPVFLCGIFGTLLVGLIRAVRNK